MFIETRIIGNKKKYYLIHSYRLGKKTKRISKYLGTDLKKEILKKRIIEEEKLILDNINILNYELTKEELEFYKDFDKKINISHLQTDWKRFTEEFTYNTNAIEGSTVALLEVKDLLNKEIKPKNSDEKESLNVAKAIEYIKDTKEILSLKLLLKIHSICFKGTKDFAGKLRDVEVIIRDGQGNIVHQGAPKEEVEGLLDELCKWYENHKDKYPALLLSAVVHNQFEKIHPFQDGNGRVGRLLLNYVLLKKKYPPINILLKNRISYYKMLQKYDKTGNVKSTLKFLINQYNKGGVYK